MASLESKITSRGGDLYSGEDRSGKGDFVLAVKIVSQILIKLKQMRMVIMTVEAQIRRRSGGEMMIRELVISDYFHHCHEPTAASGVVNGNLLLCDISSLA
ncbi:unnamed protein product [Linum trigynum]|uniref:Uncharacterized protein n=1 Tax=Linum trigynum TaxID=586398 RepID=A0AAV2ESI8_9ROSI